MSPFNKDEILIRIKNLFKQYILDSDGNVVEEPDIIKWIMNNQQNRLIAKTEICGYIVSTIFTGIGYNLFETAVIIPDKHIDIVEKYDTRKEAYDGHTKYVKMIVMGTYECPEIKNGPEDKADPTNNVLTRQVNEEQV